MGKADDFALVIFGENQAVRIEIGKPEDREFQGMRGFRTGKCPPRPGLSKKLQQPRGIAIPERSETGHGLPRFTV